LAKTYTPEELSWRVFIITAVGVLVWIAAAFYFVILKQ
jgi:hypothetical protein